MGKGRVNVTPQQLERSYGSTLTKMAFHQLGYQQNERGGELAGGSALWAVRDDVRNEGGYFSQYFTPPSFVWLESAKTTPFCDSVYATGHVHYISFLDTDTCKQPFYHVKSSFYPEEKMYLIYDIRELFHGPALGSTSNYLEEFLNEVHQNVIGENERPTLPSFGEWFNLLLFGEKGVQEKQLLKRSSLLSKL